MSTDLDQVHAAQYVSATQMKLSISDTIDAVSASAWNRLAGDNPFLNHAFLSALEHHQAVGAKSGWAPRYLLGHQAQRLVAAVPMYLKYHSRGEFVFDWAWARAYERHGLAYYPKLVIATPYTPVTGPRLLLENRDAPQATAELIRYILDYAASEQLSSLHCLFLDESDDQRLAAQSLMARSDTQYHWINHHYEAFDDFLAQLASRHRKKIKRERRRVTDAGITVTVLPGREISDQQWDDFFLFHSATYLKHGHQSPFSAEFFKEIGRTMGEQVVMVVAHKGDQAVAAALNFMSGDTLYGRYWGCLESYHSLHFEVCYYRAIDYCITHQLQRFEAGAQGEHKLIRGFYPTTTRSRHWIAHPNFRAAIQKAVSYEQQDLGRHQEMLSRYLPYKKESS